MNGWRLFAGLAALQTALFALAFVGFDSDEAGLRGLVRFTARLSFACFLPVYAASSLRRLWPTPGTRWLLRNRRHLGVSFAWAHGLHALAIVMLALLLGDAYDPSPLVVAAGSVAYPLLAAMVLTSTDRSARRIGPRRWALLHRTGIHTLWAVFAFIWTASALSEPITLPFALLAWGAALLRLLSGRARRARAADAGVVGPAAPS